MELKPSKGLRVIVNAQREAVFGDDSVSVQRVTLGAIGKIGVMTGSTLAGFCEVDMPNFDGGKHWFPIGELAGEHGEKIVEEEIPIDLDEEEPEETDEEPA